MCRKRGTVNLLRHISNMRGRGSAQPHRLTGEVCISLDSERRFSGDEEILVIGSERGNKGTATREVGWRIETAREENRMMTVIICERREEKKGETRGEHLQKTHEDLHKG